jgi:hypothetical protein
LATAAHEAAQATRLPQQGVICMIVRNAFILAALGLCSVSTAAPVAAQETSFSDGRCLAVMVFTYGQVTDPEQRSLLSVMQSFYAGKMRAKNTSLDLKAALLEEVGKLESTDLKAAATYCLGSPAQDDIAMLMTLNDKMAKK